jgi:hypothetical protein
MKKALLIVLVLVGMSGFLLKGAPENANLTEAADDFPPVADYLPGPVGILIYKAPATTGTGTISLSVTLPNFKLGSDTDPNAMVSYLRHPAKIDGKIVPVLSEFIFATDGSLVINNYEIAFTSSGPSVPTTPTTSYSATIDQIEYDYAEATSLRKTKSSGSM